MTPLFYIIIGLFGYIIGSLNSAILVGKLYKKDIKQEGSKNAGLTNVLRVLGKNAAIMVFVFDMLKGVLSAGLGYLLIKGSVHGALVGGVLTVLGHIFPVFFNFKGGKGILISFSVLLMTDWKIALICLAIFVTIVALTRYVSLGSIIGVTMAPILAIIFKHDLFFVLSLVFLMVLTIYMHRGNIKRLINKNENKLSFKKK